MIDVHCLFHPGTFEKPNIDWFAKLCAQISNEPEVNFYPVYNKERIIPGRLKGYSLGDSPYVGFVDSDDLIEPGIFRKIHKAFEEGGEVVSCLENLIDSSGKTIMPGLVQAPQYYPEAVKKIFKLKNVNHHILCFKRELLNPNYEHDSDTELKKLGLRIDDDVFSAIKDLKKRNCILIPEIGYYYRQHSKQHTHIGLKRFRDSIKNNLET